MENLWGDIRNSGHEKAMPLELVTEGEHLEVASHTGCEQGDDHEREDTPQSLVADLERRCQ